MAYGEHDAVTMTGRVVLAREEGFRLGAAEVRPSIRQIEAGGQAVTIEPRMMQVLVVLAKAKGDVVTRDELVDLCWAGRIVGDDAVNRIIWKLRQVAHALHLDFTLETIARVGFRLVAEEVVVATQQPAQIGLDRTLFSRRAAMAGAAALTALASVGAITRQLEAKAYSPDPRAKQLYGRAIELRGQGSSSESQQSLGLLQEATRIDPGYADAWGALAWAHVSLFDYAQPADLEGERVAAVAAAQRALEIEGGNPDASVALLLAKPMLGRWGQAEAACRAILAATPGHSIAEYGLAFVLAETGRLADSIGALQRVVAREPFWPAVRCKLADTLMAAGRLGEAGQQLDLAWRLWPRRHDLWRSRIWLLHASGRHVEALGFAADPANSPSISPGILDSDRAIAAAYRTSDGQVRTKALKVVTCKAAEYPLFTPAAEAALIGETDLALDLFDGYLLGQGSWGAARSSLPCTQHLFRFGTAGLRASPRFAQLAQATGLDEFWKMSGNLPDFARI